MKRVINLKYWYILVIGIALILLGAAIITANKDPYQFDEFNCGALGNQCEVGYKCEYAQCVR